MNRSVPVVNPSGDFEETIERLAKHLGQSKLRRTVFNVVYGRGSKPKSKTRIIELAQLDDSRGQQVQNELEHLSEHHLIVKLKNDGHVEDGSRYVYDKDSFVSANRDLIVRRADNKNLAERSPTKRRPAIPVRQIRRLVNDKKALKKRKKLVVLYLTASPTKGADGLRVDLEADMVRQAIRGSIYRDSIDVQFRQAADLDAILEGLNDHKPQIVHFSGHSNTSAIAADNRKITNPGYRDVSYELLAEAFKATDYPPKVVVLNSCESSGAKKLLSVVEVLISMRTGVSDLAAAAFAPKFYAAIASGQSVQAAFKQGVLAVQMTTIGEKDTPELSAKPTVNTGKLVLT
ncbi:MAG: CHAT domain-containing protein [Hyphomicrobiaceae bacterium]